MNTEFRKTVLSNGVRVITERHPHNRAVSCGVWVCSGTRDEKARINGIAHFTEHLVFKGTKKRSAFDLAKSLESVGGELNAYTTREYTCFHSMSLRDDLELSLDVLCDLVSQAEFRALDFERERDVVLQEIAMSEDTPEDWIYDIFFEKVFNGHSLGWPILGTSKSIRKIDREDVLAYYRRCFSGRQLIVSVVGDIEHDLVVEWIEKKLGSVPKGPSPQLRKKPKFAKISEFVERESEQNQILVAFPSSSFRDQGRFEAFIFNALLGGGMTSKLYQSVRERRGLAYSVYSQLATFTDTGLCAIYAGTEKKQAKKVLDLILSELGKIGKRKVSKNELKLFQTQVRGSILLGAEDIENRMNSLGVNEMVFNNYRSVDRVVFELDSVSVESLNKYIDNFFDMDRASILVSGRVGTLSPQILSRYGV